MTSQPKKRKRAKSQHTEHQPKENRFIDHRLTEQRNAASQNLDRMTAMEIVRLMNREDRKVAIAVGRELPAIARAVDAIVNGIRKGSRLFYVGAGSSGRMGVLDAAECPPTFGTSPKLVQALNAGTSQKMVLNMLSTAVMARLGHVYENLMIDVVITNEKVAERALRILAEASGKRVSAAEHALRAAGHNMRVALVMLKRGVVAREAKKLIAGAGGDLRKALSE